MCKILPYVFFVVVLIVILNHPQRLSRNNFLVRIKLIFVVVYFYCGISHEWV